MNSPFYVYIAGPLSDLPPQYLANVARMSGLSRELTNAGFTTINPAADMLEGLMSAGAWDLSVYHERSLNIMRLLAGRDASCLFVSSTIHMDGRESSGVSAEIEEAIRLHIYICYTRRELDVWREAVSS